MARRGILSLASVLALLLGSRDVRAQSLDWIAAADEDVIEVLTHDADGDLRETKVWVGVVDGVGYVRTSDTRWRENIARNADVAVRIGEREYPIRAEAVIDLALRARVNAVFRAKYGLTDRILGWWGNEGGKYQFALLPRPADP